MATIFIAVIIVVVVAGAGVAAYVVIGGNGGSDEPKGYGLGSEFTYENGTRTVTGAVVGVGESTYVIEFTAGGTTYFEVDVDSGKLLFQGQIEEPSSSTGTGDDWVGTWTVTGGTTVSVKKINGLYTVCDVKFNGTTYSIDADKNVVKTPDKLPDIIGKRLVYKTHLTADVTIDLVILNTGLSFSSDFDATTTITYQNAAAEGKYLFTVETEFSYVFNGETSTDKTFSYVRADGVTYETIFSGIPDGLVPHMSTQPSVQRNVDLHTVDGDVKVDKYTYTLTYANLGLPSIVDIDGTLTTNVYVGKDYVYKSDFESQMTGFGFTLDMDFEMTLDKVERV
ncbi:MAG: hypothetical protein LBT41_04090 [Candidatus Methanoplasma sp.]|nr:hypothetical protein [Candidatus Methanoplasma sp.]